jgi:hypothetical protein
MITGATNYFCNKWNDKFHEEPSIEKLNTMLENKSIQVQSFALYYNGKKKSLDSVLVVYWIPEEGLIFKVDPTSRSLVTFYCREDLMSIDQEKLDKEEKEVNRR